jgi:prevent-host-death family protein
MVRPMFLLGEDVQPLSDFKRKTSEVLQRLRLTGRPILLTLNGRAEVIVQDAMSYQKLLQRLQELENLTRQLRYASSKK